MRTKSPSWPSETETHPAMDWAEIPPELAAGGDPEASQGRLRPELVEVAGDPLRALRAAVLAPASHPTIAQAFADLAVTGHGAFEQFVAMGPARLVERVVAEAVEKGLAPGEARERAVRFVDRAQLVSRWLRAPTSSERAAAFLELGRGAEARPWIAVAGERDPPDRPVNLPATRFDQVDVLVPWPGRKPIRVRAAMSEGVRGSDRPILLFIHGLGSRIEETEAVGTLLADRGYGILALDLPNQGYSERFAFEEVGVALEHILGAGPGPTSGATLEFYAHFLGGFLRKLDHDHGRILERLVAVCGGSQGGCLTLRLSLPESPVKASSYIPWSPGAVWTSFKQERLHALGLRYQSDRVRARDGEHLSEERPERRGDYIRGLFDVPMLRGVLPRPVDTWWRDSWPHKERAARESRMLRWEVYHKQHRLWCDAVGYEQLVCSFRGPTNRKSPPWPIETAVAPLLLMAGDQDNLFFANIHTATKALGGRGDLPSGLQVTFEDTGHSIHDERPSQLAREIQAFLQGHVLGAAGPEK